MFTFESNIASFYPYALKIASFYPYALKIASFYPYALKGQKLLAQGNTLGFYGPNLSP